MAEKQVYSKEAYDSLVHRLEYLKNTRRGEVIHEIEVARGFGDLSENAEYDEARTEQAKVEAEIKELEEKLHNAEILDEAAMDHGIVSVGSRVRVRDFDYDEEEEYVIVSSNEVNSEENRISNLSPIGKALSGHKAGDTVTVVVENTKGDVIKSYDLNIIGVDRENRAE